MTSPSGGGPLIVHLRQAGNGLAGMFMPGFGVADDVVTINTRLVSEHRIADVVAWAESQRRCHPERIAFLMAVELNSMSVA